MLVCVLIRATTRAMSEVASFRSPFWGEQVMLCATLQDMVTPMYKNLLYGLSKFFGLPRICLSLSIILYTTVVKFAYIL